MSDDISRTAARAAWLARIEHAMQADPLIERDLRDRLNAPPMGRDALVQALLVNAEMARQELVRLLDQGDVFAVDACLKATWRRAIADLRLGRRIWWGGIKGIGRWSRASWLTGWRNGGKS